eukprot:403332565
MIRNNSQQSMKSHRSNRSNQSTRSNNRGNLQVSSPRKRPRVNQLTKLEMLIRILQKGFRQRTDKDLDQLVPLIKAIQFFQEREIKDQDYLEIVSCLTYEHFQKDETVFEYGHSGEKFYIILQGCVRVLIPDYANKEVISQIEGIRHQIKLLKNELREVQTQIDYEKKIQEEYEKMLQEEELYRNDISDRGSVASRQLQDRKITRHISMQKKPDSMQFTNHSFGKKREFGMKNQTFVQQQDIKAKFSMRDTQSNAFAEESSKLNQLEMTMKLNKSKKQLQNSDMTLEERKQLLIEQINKLKQQEESTCFVEVVQLNTGKSFGELALIKNKPRAATIKCAEDCHLAIMSKADYDKVLSRIEQKNLNKILGFLHQLPFLHNWSKIQLQKLQYCFEQKVLKRGTVLYKEGESCSTIYVIKNGEFEVAKKVKVGDDQDGILETMHNMLGPQGGNFNSKMQGQKRNPDEITSFKDFMHSRKVSETDRYKQNKHQNNSLNQSVTLTTKKKKLTFNDEKLQQLGNSKIMAAQGGQKSQNTYKIAQIGTGQLLGEEDIIAQRNYSTTVTCKSNVGEVYCIKSQEFVKKIKVNPESWKIVILMSMAKEKAIFERIKKIKKLLRKNQNVGDIDVREKFKEIINDYPFIDPQKEIVQRGQGKNTDQQLNTSIDKDISLKKTIDINLRTLSANQKQRYQIVQKKLPTITKQTYTNNQPARKTKVVSQLGTLANNSRSQSPLSILHNTAPKQTYISSKIADLLAASVNGKNLNEELKNQIVITHQQSKKIFNQQSKDLNKSVIIQPSSSNVKVMLNQSSNISLNNFNPLLRNHSKDIFVFQPNQQKQSINKDEQFQSIITSPQNLQYEQRNFIQSIAACRTVPPDTMIFNRRILDLMRGKDTRIQIRGGRVKFKQICHISSIGFQMPKELPYPKDLSTPNQELF